MVVVSDHHIENREVVGLMEYVLRIDKVTRCLAAVRADPDDKKWGPRKGCGDLRHQVSKSTFPTPVLLVSSQQRQQFLSAQQFTSVVS